MVAASGVRLSARRGGGRVGVAPIANMLERNSVRSEARARGLLTVARVPLPADVGGGRELLLRLLPLPGLPGLPLGTGLAGVLLGLGFDVRSGTYEVVPIRLDFSSGEESLAVTPVIGVFPQDKVTKLDQCPGGVGIILQLVFAEIPVQ